MDIRTQVLTGLRWTAGTRLLAQGFTWLVTIVVIRILTPEDYGLLAIATLFTGFLSMLSEAGLGSAVVQAKELDDVALRKVFGFVLVINLVLCLILVLGAPLIAWLFEEERLILMIQALALSFLLVGFTAMPEALLDRRLAFKKRALVDLSSSVFGSALTLALAAGRMGVWALVLGTIGTALWRAVGLQWLAPFLKRPILSFDGLGGILGFGRNIVFSRLLWYFFSQIDVLIAGKLLGKELLGIYSVSMHLASLPAQKLGAITYRVSFPAFAKLQGEAERTRMVFLQMIRITSFWAFPVLWGISSVSPDIVHLFLGPRWDDAAPLLALLCLFMPLRILSPVVYSAIDGLGRPDIGVRNMLVASIIMPIAFIVGCNWGLMGLALSWVLVFPLVFIENMSRLLPVVHIKLKEFLATMARPIVGSAVMYAVVAITREMVRVGPVPEMAVLILAGILAYGIFTLLLNRPVLEEMLALVRH